jgi:hypothetical protein
LQIGSIEETITVVGAGNDRPAAIQPGTRQQLQRRAEEPGRRAAARCRGGAGAMDGRTTRDVGVIQSPDPNLERAVVPPCSHDR